ncbi:hypothetical protein PROFUN_05539 [Planoprotostelium fungivorum]|uniref:Uncharacterized protein n=1 Tax=Planoprotostelium fungivorum TaxID=1890364 RepID=A0A2P6N032_9EUKA|nr:hypothetical protein PROFUN_05539 [Planoprotostelium fungivorum]
MTQWWNCTSAPFASLCLLYDLSVYFHPDCIKQVLSVGLPKRTQEESIQCEAGVMLEVLNSSTHSKISGKRQGQRREELERLEDVYCEVSNSIALSIVLHISCETRWFSRNRFGCCSNVYSVCNSFGH